MTANFRAIATAAATTITVLGAALAYTALPGHAQEFKGECKTIKEQAACTASGWCRWSNRKAVQLPNGQAFEPEGFCGFRPGFKAGYKATQQQVATPVTK